MNEPSPSLILLPLPLLLLLLLPWEGGKGEAQRTWQACCNKRV